MNSEELKRSAMTGNVSGSILETVLKGLSAYEIACKQGFIGTEQEWLQTINVEFTEYQPSDDIYQIEFTSGNDATGKATIKTPNLTPVTKTVDRVIAQLDFNNRITQTLEEAKTYTDSKKSEANTYTDNQVSNAKSELSNADTVLGNRITSLEEHDISTDVITFSDASSQENVASGETLATIIAKVKSWFGRLKSAAFSDVANNLTTASGGYVLDARQGKQLSDSITAINQNKVDKQDGYSMVSDTEIARLSTVNNYDDAEIVSQISGLQSKIDELKAQIEALSGTTT